MERARAVSGVVVHGDATCNSSWRKELCFCARRPTMTIDGDGGGIVLTFGRGRCGLGVLLSELLSEL